MGWNYPNWLDFGGRGQDYLICTLAVRRTARAGAIPGVGLQLRGARFRLRWLRPVLVMPYSFRVRLRAPGWAEGPTRRPGDHKGSRQFRPNHRPLHRPNLSELVLACYFVLNLSSPPAVSATSPDELQPAARGGGELRDPSSRSSNAFSVKFSLVARAGRSLRGPQQRQLRASAAGGFGPRDPKGRTSTAQNPAKSTAQPTAPCSARHGSKTGYGFRTRRTARPKAQPSSPSRVRLTAAPLSLRRSSSTRLGKSCQNVPAHFLTISFLRRGARATEK